MNWIKIAVGIMDDPCILDLSEALGVSAPLTTGCVVGVLTHLPSHARTGDLSAVTDRTLEQWAQWPGKKGKFAAAFRAHLCDGQGVVRSWHKHNGAAIRESDQAKERMRAARKARRENAERAANGAANVPGTFSERSLLRDGTGSNYESQATSDSLSSGRSSSPRSRDEVEEAVRSLAAAGVTQTPDAFRQLLAAVPNPTAWAAALVGLIRGQGAPGGRPVSSARLAIATADFLAAGRHTQRPSLGAFRRFVEKAADPVSPARTHHLNADELKATELREIRECNVFLRQRGRPPKPEPTWAAEIDAKFADGRTRPDLREVAA